MQRFSKTKKKCKKSDLRNFFFSRQLKQHERTSRYEMILLPPCFSLAVVFHKNQKKWKKRFRGATHKGCSFPRYFEDSWGLCEASSLRFSDGAFLTVSGACTFVFFTVKKCASIYAFSQKTRRIHAPVFMRRERWRQCFWKISETFVTRVR